MHLDARFSLPTFCAAIPANQRRHMKGPSSAKSGSQTSLSRSREKNLQDQEKRYGARIKNGEINVNHLKIVVVGDGACGKVSARICLGCSLDHIESSRHVCFMPFRKDVSLKYVVSSS